jgi:hypothetical protein
VVKGNMLQISHTQEYDEASASLLLSTENKLSNFKLLQDQRFL